MNAEKPLGRYDSVDRAVTQGGEEVFVGNTDANGNQTVVSPDQILKSYGDHTVAERTAYNQGVVDNGGTIPEGIKIPVTDANEITGDTPGQAATPVEVIPAAEPPAPEAVVAEPVTLPTPEELPVAPAESESANSSLEKQVSELAELIKALSSQMEELLEQNKQILDRLDRLEGKEPEVTPEEEPEETPEEKALREAQERQETHFSMLSTDSKGEEAPEGGSTSAENPDERRSRWQRTKDRLKSAALGAPIVYHKWMKGEPLFKEENSNLSDEDKEKQRRRRRNWRALGLLGIFGAGVLTGYLLDDDGGTKDAITDIDTSQGQHTEVFNYIDGDRGVQSILPENLTQNPVPGGYEQILDNNSGNVIVDHVTYGENGRYSGETIREIQNHGYKVGTNHIELFDTTGPGPHGDITHKVSEVTSQG